MGCDTLVALPPATQDGATLFAKNSDRPPRECQRIVQLPRARHAPGTAVRCQYLEIPQVAETAAILGSQPYWLWGLEHGVNEHRVSIGNETVFTKSVLGETGLLGMDLVRFGLERSRTAIEAVDVVTGLLEAHGQGGSGQRHLHWPYDNAFLIADPTSAWVLETADRRWAAKPVTGVGNISNGLALGTDWTRASADATAYAVAQGWWAPAAGRVDFRAAYADESGVPPHQCVARRQRGAMLLAEGNGQLRASAMRRVLRDHYDGGTIHRPRAFEDPLFFSLCMHADPLDNTTASMVVRLPADASDLVLAWVSLGSPCVGAFVPCWPEGPVPPRLAIGGETPDPESPWWRMRVLLDLVERDFAARGPLVRERFDELEVALDAEAAETHAAARGLSPAARGSLLGACMERAVDAWLDGVAELVRRFGG